MAAARWFLTGFTHDNGTETLRNYLGDFYLYNGTCWPVVEDALLESGMYKALENQHYMKVTEKRAEIKPWEPNRRKVGDVLAAMGAAVHLAGDPPPPVWLNHNDIPASEIVSMQNGLLHVPSRRLLPHDPNYFCQHALAFPFDPDAPKSERWLRFLAELWGDDLEAISALQEIMGYILGGGTEQQKLFLMVGPRRSGKGTIARVLKVLLGEHNTAGPTLAGMATNFGLQGLIGKPLAVVSDMRIGSRADSMVAVERLLTISGEDIITVDRKYKDPWTGQLPTRFLILSNELPRFADASGALASRFVLLTLQRSFYGKEDVTLTKKLTAEATGILNWALEGLDRLNDRGAFLVPTSAAEALRQLEDLSSPVGAFVRDRCIVGPAHEEDKDVLWSEWKSWCDEEGRARPGTKAVFLRDLRAAVPGVQTIRPRIDGKQVYRLQGLAIHKEGPPLTLTQEPVSQGESGSLQLYSPNGKCSECGGSAGHTIRCARSGGSRRGQSDF
jgi:putative DNA primase/helicase